VHTEGRMHTLAAQALHEVFLGGARAGAGFCGRGRLCREETGWQPGLCSRSAQIALPNAAPVWTSCALKVVRPPGSFAKAVSLYSQGLALAPAAEIDRRGR
jgi:hypothetical protein